MKKTIFTFLVLLIGNTANGDFLNQGIKNVGGFIKDPANTTDKEYQRTKKKTEQTYNGAKRNIQRSPTSTFGEAGRQLYVDAANVMAVRHVGHKHHRIGSLDARALSVYFGNLVNNVTLVFGARMLDKWGSGKYTITLSKVDTAAQTYGSTIYIARNPSQMTDYERLSTLTHELVHVQQNQKYSNMSNFGYHYFRKFAEANFSYAGNQLEKEAYAIGNGEPMRLIWDAYRRNTP